MAALRCYPYGATIIPRKICSRTLVRASSMDSCSSSQSKQASSSVSFTCKVYEYKNIGILCYTAGSGELVCQGLDEGPRLTWQDMENLSKERLAGEDAADCGVGSTGATFRLLLAWGKAENGSRQA